MENPVADATTGERAVCVGAAATVTRVGVAAVIIRAVFVVQVTLTWEGVAAGARLVASVPTGRCWIVLRAGVSGGETKWLAVKPRVFARSALVEGGALTVCAAAM